MQCRAALAALTAAALCPHFAAAQGGTGAASLPGVVKGWNASVGTAADRAQVEKYFNVSIADNDSLWQHNKLSLLAGRDIKIVDFSVIERNAINTAIEVICKTQSVVWTLQKGPGGIVGDMVEHVDGFYTGLSKTAGWVGPNSWVETDSKYMGSITTLNDWGINTIVDQTADSVTIMYWSMKKGKFSMRWQLQAEPSSSDTWDIYT